MRGDRTRAGVLRVPSVRRRPGQERHHQWPPRCCPTRGRRGTHQHLRLSRACGCGALPLNSFSPRTVLAEPPRATVSHLLWGMVPSLFPVAVCTKAEDCHTRDGRAPRLSCPAWYPASSRNSHRTRHRLATSCPASHPPSSRNSPKSSFTWSPSSESWTNPETPHILPAHDSQAPTDASQSRTMVCSESVPLVWPAGARERDGPARTLAGGTLTHGLRCCGTNPVPPCRAGPAPLSPQPETLGACNALCGCGGGVRWRGWCALAGVC